MKRILLPLITSAIILACNDAADSSNETVDTVQTTDSTQLAEQQERNTIENAFPQLFDYYHQQDSSFSSSYFSLNEIVTIDSSQAYQTQPKLKAFYPYLIYNSDSSLAIDLFSYSYVPMQQGDNTSFAPGSPDSEVGLIDVKNTSRKRLLFNGPSVIVLDARWLTNDEIVVAGAEDLGNGKLKPIMWKVNLVANSLQLYTYEDTIVANVQKYLQQKLKTT